MGLLNRIQRSAPITKHHQTSPRRFELGAWRVDPQARTITATTERRRLQPRLMDVLVALAEAYPNSVTREALLSRVWKVEHLSPQALNNAIAKLRIALGDSEIIQTERLAGYRLAIEPVWVSEKRVAAHAGFASLVRAHPWAARAVFLLAVTLAGGAWLMLRPTDDPLVRFLRDNPGNWVVEVQEPEGR